MAVYEGQKYSGGIFSLKYKMLLTDNMFCVIEMALYKNVPQLQESGSIC